MERSQTNLDQPVLYITGRGGDHTKGLGGHISTLVSNYTGISVDVQYLRQDIDDQVEVIRAAISECSGGRVIANSYGAYLTLLALIDFEHELEQVVLLSPVLGAAMAKDRMYFSRPPATKRLRDAVAEMMGEEKVFVLQGERHNLTKTTVQDILDTTLGLKHISVIWRKLPQTVLNRIITKVIVINRLES